MKSDMSKFVPMGKSVGIAAYVMLCALVAPQAGAVDGTCWQNYTNPSVKWSQHTYSWVNCIVARDGGVATIKAATKLEQDETGLVLGGIDFTTVSTYLYGKGITLTGDAFLRGTKYLSGNAWRAPTPTIAVPLSGTGSNTITKRGVAEITICSPFADIGALDVPEGALVMTNAPSS